MLLGSTRINSASGGGARGIARGMLCSLAIGLALGAANGVCGVLSTGNDTRFLLPDPWRTIPLVIAGILGTTWAWGLTAFLVGRLVRHPLRGALLGILALWLAVPVYYGIEVFASSSHEAFDRGEAQYWLQAALPAGLVFGGLGGCLGLRGRRWAFAVLPVLWYVWEHPDLFSSLTSTAVLVANRVACAVLVLMVVMRLVGWRRPRARAEAALPAAS